ncbi:MAG: C4-type zinc ribbon domain-containing protein [Deltaproteobacteria bacterium]|nr:C4-type zinc ribbon domain-containing protein [Deltaproteobacteria bacterium]
MDIEHLKQLQEVDIEITTVSQEKFALEETLKKDEDGYRSAEQAIAEFNKNYEQLDADKRAKEAEIQQTNEMIKRWDTRLKEAKSGREYQAFMREINGAKKDIGEIENAVLKIMEDMEKIDKDRDQQKQQLDEIGKRLQQMSAQSKEKISFLAKQIEGFETERGRIAKNVSSGLLGMYEQIRKQRNVAIVAVKKSVCQGCYMNIPPQLYNEVMMNSRIIHCPHCQRILYYDAEDHGVVERKPKRNKKSRIDVEL